MSPQLGLSHRTAVSLLSHWRLTGVSMVSSWRLTGVSVASHRCLDSVSLVSWCTNCVVSVVTLRPILVWMETRPGVDTERV